MHARNALDGIVCDSMTGCGMQERRVFLSHDRNRQQCKHAVGLLIVQRHTVESEVCRRAVGSLAYSSRLQTCEQGERWASGGK